MMIKCCVTIISQIISKTKTVNNVSIKYLNFYGTYISFEIVRYECDIKIDKFIRYIVKFINGCNQNGAFS